MFKIVLILLTSVYSGFLAAADLKVFTEPRQAISFARTEGKLIVFLLWDSRDKNHLPVAEKLKADLNLLNSEFVLVNLSNSQKKNRDLFSGRFSQDITELPVAVVSNDSGEAITSTRGVEPLEYDRLLLSARIEGGKISDPVKLANLRESLKNVGENRGFLSPMVEDLGRKKVAVTKMRNWVKKDGTPFKAILLEALGDRGVFIDETGASTEIPFVDLSASDIQFLQTVLTVIK